MKNYTNQKTVTAQSLFNKNTETGAYKQSYYKNIIFKKNNFFVSVFGIFKVFSYEGNFDNETVSVTIKNSSNDEIIKFLKPSIDSVSKLAVNGVIGEVLSITYEEFCDALYEFIVNNLATDETLV